MQTSPLVISDQVLGDNFGFNLQFPYNINGWAITMTLKKKLSQTDAQADAHASATPLVVSSDANGNYNVTLALLPGVTALLSPQTYYFDIVTKDMSNNVEHVISPESSVSFIKPVTQSP